MSGLANKTFIVTGASLGIGRALAVELARRGARLVLNARSADNLEAAAMAAAEAAPDGPLTGEDAVAMVPGSAADPDTAGRLVDTAMAMSGRDSPALHGLVHAAGIAQPGIAAYCAAKAAEEHLVRQLAVEAPAVTSLVYRPGVVETRMQAQARQAEGGAADILRPVFRSWKDQGQLLTPEASARALATIMEDPRPFHGRVATVDDGR